MICANGFFPIAHFAPFLLYYNHFYDRRQHPVNPEMIKKIDDVLECVKDPESGLPVSRLGVVQRVRYSDDHKMLYIFMDFKSHMPHCSACTAVAGLVVDRIVRDLAVEFHVAFPDLDVEFV
jgi:metal-sulfur cluster biosynthetic enzyme